ncbi:MAG TPA: hypothetical protein VGD87_04935 [Archangium sp.]
MKRAGLLLVLAAVLVASACNSDPSKQPPKYRLEGSLGSVMDLGYDEARVLVAPTDISLLFVRIKPLGGTSEDGGVIDPMMMQGTSEDYPLRLGYRFDLEQLDGGRLDLAELDGNGNQRGVVSRTVQNDPRNTLPPLARGTLFFKEPLLPNAVVHGDFHVTFENGVEAASGRTAFSTSFTARVQP